MVRCCNWHRPGMHDLTNVQPNRTSRLHSLLAVHVTMSSSVKLDVLLHTLPVVGPQHLDLGHAHRDAPGARLLTALALHNASSSNQYFNTDVGPMLHAQEYAVPGADRLDKKHTQDTCTGLPVETAVSGKGGTALTSRYIRTLTSLYRLRTVACKPPAAMIVVAKTFAPTTPGHCRTLGVREEECASIPSSKRNMQVIHPVAAQPGSPHGPTAPH